MKVAVLLFGEYRQFEYSIQSLKVFDDFETDFYVSTWDYSSEVVEELNIKIQKNISIDDVTKFLPKAKVSIKHDSDLIIDKMQFHWNVLKNLVEQSQKNYDILILKRIDSFLYDFDKQKFLETEFNGSIFVNSYYYHEEESWWSDDNIFISDKETLFKFIDLVPEHYRTHFGIGDVLFNNNFDVKIINFLNYYILRPNMIHLISDDYQKSLLKLKSNYEILHQNYFRIKYPEFNKNTNLVKKLF
jgi:hypothetical protein